jgi:hypothetical protein
LVAHDATTIASMLAAFRRSGICRGNVQSDSGTEWLNAVLPDRRWLAAASQRSRICIRSLTLWLSKATPTSLVSWQTLTPIPLPSWPPRLKISHRLTKLLPQSLLWTRKSGMRKALSTILVTGPMLTRRAGDVAGEGFAKKERLSGEREMFLKVGPALGCSESLIPTSRSVGIPRRYTLLPPMASIDW